jgi:hypothetical protein
MPVEKWESGKFLWSADDLVVRQQGSGYYPSIAMLHVEKSMHAILCFV